MCVYTYVQVWMLSSFLDWITLHLTFLMTAWLTNLIRLPGQQASGILYLPPKHKSRHPAFTWVLGIQSQIFMLAQKPSILSTTPSPHIPIPRLS